MIVELFSGARGSGVGIARALPEVEAVGLEKDADSCATSIAAGMPTIRCDLAHYPPDPFRGITEGLWASPPCTDFSRAGKRQGLDGESGRFIFTAQEWAEALHPEWIVFEQVPDVLPWWKQFAKGFAQAGYETWVGVLNSANYGVPQTRERAILLASLRHPVVPPEPTHAKFPHPRMFSEDELPWVSMADALGWGLESPSYTVTAGGTETGGAEPFGRHARRVLATHRDQRPDGSTQEVSLERPAVTVSGKSYGQWRLYYGLGDRGTREQFRNVDQPSPTLALGHDVASWSWVEKRPAITILGNGRVFPPNGHHPEMGLGHASSRSVRVTLEELAILQDFPADWPFKGNKTSIARQIGNAVPAKLAEVCVRAVA